MLHVDDLRRWCVWGGRDAGEGDDDDSGIDEIGERVRWNGGGVVVDNGATVHWEGSERRSGSKGECDGEE